MYQPRVVAADIAGLPERGCAGIMFSWDLRSEFACDIRQRLPYQHVMMLRGQSLDRQFSVTILRQLGKCRSVIDDVPEPTETLPVFRSVLN
jgi:hypothetical protein